MRQNDFLKGYIMPSRPVWYGCNHLISKVTKAFREQHGLEAGPQVSAHRALPVRGRAKGLLQQSGVLAVLFPKPFAARRAGQTDPAASCVIVSLDLLPNSLGSRQLQAQGARFLLPSPPRLWLPLVSTKPFFWCLLTVSLDLKCVHKLIVFKFCTSAVKCFIGSTMTKH